MKTTRFFLILMILFIAACTNQALPRKIPSAEEINQKSAQLKAITDANREAHNARDEKAIQALFSEDVLFDDVTFEDHLVGIKALMEFTHLGFIFLPNFHWEAKGHFIGSEQIVRIAKFWGANMSGNPNKVYTEDNPFIHVFLYELKGDLITTWQLFYGYDFLKDNGLLSKTVASTMQSWPSSYASAWSSLDSKVVRGLYARDAVRQDTLFGESQEGCSAIQSFAETFFSWYPKTRWTPHLIFGERKWPDKPQAVGSTFTIEVSDSSDKTCEVLAVVLLQVLDGKIIQEDLYYEPESLIRCGWAK